MGLGRDISLRVDRDAAGINTTLGGSGIHTAFHVVDALWDLSACQHLVVEESHIRILMGTILSSSPRIHSLRIEHEVLRLRHHLITS